MAERTYPDWVQKHRTKGTTVKKVGRNYYLYKHTSKRVPGKKNPVPVDTYLGVITPEGVIPGARRKLETAEAEVREYGFTKAIQVLCPDSWKKVQGDQWEDIFNRIILEESPESYITKEKKISEIDPHVQYGIQKKRLWDRIYKQYHVKQDELDILRTIYLIYIDGRKIVSKISEEQQQLLTKLEINMEVR